MTIRNSLALIEPEFQFWMRGNAGIDVDDHSWEFYGKKYSNIVVPWGYLTGTNFNMQDRDSLLKEISDIIDNKISYDNPFIANYGFAKILQTYCYKEIV